MVGLGILLVFLASCGDESSSTSGTTSSFIGDDALVEDGEIPFEEDDEIDFDVNNASRIIFDSIFKRNN